MAYYAIDPWDEQRADLRNAMSLAVAVNTNRDPQKEPAQISDFMPYANPIAPKPKKEKTEADDKLSTMRAWFAPLIKKRKD